MLVNMVTNSSASEDEKETGRIEAFSEDVFTTAITLLIFDIKVPRAADLHGGKLDSALIAQRPYYLAYLISWQYALDLISFLSFWASVGMCFALALFIALPDLAGKASKRGRGLLHPEFTRKPVNR
jgi:uncharacterized membrane protein